AAHRDASTTRSGRLGTLRDHLSFESVVAQSFNRNASPLIGWMQSTNPQFEIVVCQCFGRIRLLFAQCDRLKCATNKSHTKTSMLYPSKLAQHPIAFACNPHWHLIRHGSRQSTRPR